MEKIQSCLISETLDTENNDFVELLMYSKDEGVLMTGKMTDGDQTIVINYNIIIISVYFNRYIIISMALNLMIFMSMSFILSSKYK